MRSSYDTKLESKDKVIDKLKKDEESLCEELLQARSDTNALQESLTQLRADTAAKDSQILSMTANAKPLTANCGREGFGG